jgi:hypothetical protein
LFFIEKSKFIRIFCRRRERNKMQRKEDSLGSLGLILSETRSLYIASQSKLKSVVYKTEGSVLPDFPNRLIWLPWMAKIVRQQVGRRRRW